VLVLEMGGKTSRASDRNEEEPAGFGSWVLSFLHAPARLVGLFYSERGRPF